MFQGLTYKIYKVKKYLHEPKVSISMLSLQNFSLENHVIVVWIVCVCLLYEIAAASPFATRTTSVKTADDLFVEWRSLFSSWIGRNSEHRLGTYQRYRIVCRCQAITNSSIFQIYLEISQIYLFVLIISYLNICCCSNYGIWSSYFLCGLSIWNLWI